MPHVWKKAQELTKMLVGDGWVSPNTYCNHFAPLTEGSAVYLFLLVKSEDYQEALVAYVGMSVRLTQRIAGHNILPELDMPGYWPMVWFKPVAKAKLRETEAEYITAFDPPWNIQGRVRGVPLQ